ncbi:MAG: fimbrial protein [Gammaproteobacteria bacterium HGW-Gammaproteobacteria-4]|jgi:type IV pilus assembly protein PilO|nr:MAG: fimbrial protein [Gammaproteobacteria bacterium HGW-Gammaproteobacteria-4]
MSKPIDLKSLDLNDAGNWPTPIKAAAAVIIGLLVLLLAWYLIISEKSDVLANLKATETELRSSFEVKQARASNLEPLKEQLAQMEAMLQQMLRQLPSRTEMPDLIVDISQTALASGISNDLFQPGAEVAREFYAEKPIALRMTGTYHQFGAFVSGVASLPRVVIMTMHDISLKPLQDKSGAASDTLVLAGTVKTYRYLDEEEVEEAAKAADTKAGGR